MNSTTMEQRRIKALATTRQRAETLFADGYKVAPTEAPGRYFVSRPTPRIIKKTGEVIEGYFVSLNASGVLCECVQFQRQGECKHGNATKKAVIEALRLAGPFLATPVLIDTETRATASNVGLSGKHDPWKSSPVIPAVIGCNACSGDGRVERWQTCSECDGRCEVLVPEWIDGDRYPTYRSELCQSCDGQGNVRASVSCSVCDGAGEVPNPDATRVRPHNFPQMEDYDNAG